jgi:hypothetical protein
MDHLTGGDPHNLDLDSLNSLKIDPHRVSRLQEKYSICDSLEDEYESIKRKILELQVKWRALEYLEE